MVSGVSNNNSLLLNFSQPTDLGGLFSNLANFTSLGDVTVNGTITASAVLLILLVVAGLFGWNAADAHLLGET